MSEDQIGPTPLSTLPGEPLAPAERMPVETGWRSRATGTLILVAIVMVILLLCACTVGSMFLFRAAFDGVSEAADAAAVSVAWSGEGDFAVIQTRDDEGTPLVVAWERESGEVLTRTGYYVVAVEPYGARAWLVPAGDPATFPVLWNYSRGDTPADDLYIWKLGEDRLAQADEAEIAWEPWPGPAAWSARAVVDAARGVYPARVWFENRDTPGHEVRVTLPSDVGTFDIVGWSPSGEYLALVEFSGVEAPSPLSGETDLDASADGPAAPDPRVSGAGRVFIVEAASGEVVAIDEGSLAFGPGEVPAVWHPVEDVLLLAAIADDVGAEGEWQGSTRLQALVPDGSTQDAGGLFGFAIPSEWDTAWVSFAGSGRDGVIILADGETWTLGSERLVRTGALPASYSTASHPAGGILTVVDEWNDRGNTVRTVVSVSDDRGSGTRAIWEGPELSVRFGVGKD